MFLVIIGEKGTKSWCWLGILSMIGLTDQANFERKCFLVIIGEKGTKSWCWLTWHFIYGWTD